MSNSKTKGEDGSQHVPIPRFPLSSKVLWQRDGSPVSRIRGTPNVQALLEHFRLEGRLTQEDAVLLTRKAGELFKKESNLLKLKEPITVCGDIHGQYFDLLRLLQAGGDPKETQYLFLGDYVDRGCFSCECVLLLFALKINYPKTFFMLRGNHECRHLTSFFNFQDECNFKYSEVLYDEIMNSFDKLPIAATINKKFLCLHGGLSPDVSTLADINAIDRFREVPREGPFCDLLWADPSPDKSKKKKSSRKDAKHRKSTKGDETDSSSDYSDDEDEDEDGSSDDDDMFGDEAERRTTWFAYNEARQCSYVFGVDAVTQFLERNKLTAVIRAHEAQSQGYKMHMADPGTGIPKVITIFSAPNYCDVYGNKAACLKFDNDLLNIRQFVHSPHPYYLPNFMDVFAWSLPFVSEKVTDLLANVVNWTLQEDDADDDSADEKEAEAALAESAPAEVTSSSDEIKRKSDSKQSVLRDKVLAITKMLRMHKLLREQNDLVIQLKQLTPSQKLPLGILSQGKGAIEQAISSFNEARKADAPNERMPGDVISGKRSNSFSEGVPKDSKKKRLKAKAKDTTHNLASERGKRASSNSNASTESQSSIRSRPMITDEKGGNVIL